MDALVATGHEVSALARSPEKAAVLRAQGASPVTVSMFDRLALQEAFVGHDAVVNLATSMPTMATFVFRRAWTPTERVRIEGSAAVVDGDISGWQPKYPSAHEGWLATAAALDGAAMEAPERRTGS